MKRNFWRRSLALFMSMAMMAPVANAMPINLYVMPGVSVPTNINLPDEKQKEVKPEVKAEVKEEVKPEIKVQERSAKVEEADVTTVKPEVKAVPVTVKPEVKAVPVTVKPEVKAVPVTVKPSPSAVTNEKKPAPKVQKSNAESINSGIRSLQYDKNTVLANDGENITSYKKLDGIKKADKFIVVKKEKKSITSSPIDVSIVDAMSDRTYPGAVQLANKNFVENRPDVVIADRKPIQISIDLPGLGKEGSTIVENPNYANISAAVDSMVNKWLDNYSSRYTIPARTQYNEYMVHSKSQIEAALNVNAKFLENQLGIDFNAIEKGEKQVMIATYKQIFYQVNANIPSNPADLFADNVTFADLQAKGVNDNNPPLLVNNVSYGRTIYVKMETSSKSKDVQEAFSAAIKGVVNIGQNAKYNDVLDKADFTAVILGGGAQSHNKIVSKNIDEIRDVIKNNAEVSAQNPGYPISYTSTFLKDNSLAQVKNRAEYVETTATEYSQGKINIKHKGAYVAQFKIAWDEISYDDNGKQVLTHKEWDQNWKDKTAPFSSVVSLPANATNIEIYAREATGLAWDWWRDVIHEKNVPLTGNTDVNIWGTTLRPKHEFKQY